MTVLCVFQDRNSLNLVSLKTFNVTSDSIPDTIVPLGILNEILPNQCIVLVRRCLSQAVGFRRLIFLDICSMKSESCSI